MTFNSLQPWRDISINEDTYLPVALKYACGVRLGDFIYIMGGLDNTYRAEYTVYYSKINSDGTITKWLTTSELIDAVYGACAVTKGDYIYIMGGYNLKYINGNSLNSWGEIDTVYYAKKNIDGTLEEWTPTSTLKKKSTYACAVISGNYIYIIGGQSDTGFLNTVYSAFIKNNGELEEWILINTLPEPIWGASAVTFGNFIYIIGGLNQTSKSARYIYSAKIKSDGKLENWINLSLEVNTLGIYSLPTDLIYSSAIISGKCIFVIGGYNNSTVVSTVYSTKINDDGKITPWEDLSRNTYNYLRQPLAGICCVTDNKYIYIISGYNSVNTTNFDTLNILNTVYSAELTYIPSPTPTPTTIPLDYTPGPISQKWQIINKLPVSLKFTCSVTSGNYIYVIGGFNTTSQETVYSAKIKSDGTLDSWILINNLPQPIYLACAVTDDKYIYIMGGYNETTSLNTVYSAKIKSDGTLESWRSLTPLSQPIYGACAVTNKIYIYIMGGHNGTNVLSTIYTAKINEDGTLTFFPPKTSFYPLYYASAVILDSYIYVIGGYYIFGKTSAYFNTVLLAQIESDGTLKTRGTTKAGTPMQFIDINEKNRLPQKLIYLCAVISNNCIFVMGGSNTYVQNTVYSANIKSDGTLYNWIKLSDTTNNPLPNPLVQSSAVAWNNNVYIIGGHNGKNNQSLVYSAALFLSVPIQTTTITTTTTTTTTTSTIPKITIWAPKVTTTNNPNVTTTNNPNVTTTNRPNVTTTNRPNVTTTNRLNVITTARPNVNKACTIL